jgi:tol-pal system protein YbgF
MSFRASSVSLLALAFLATACSSGSDKVKHDNDELRRMLVETRTDLEEVKRDQEQLRAKLDYLQYARGTGAAGAAAPTPAPAERWPADPWGATDSYPAGRSLNSLEPGTPVPSAPPSMPPPVASPGSDVTASATLPGAPPASEPARVASAHASASPGAAAAFQTAPPVVPQNLSGTKYDRGVQAFNEGNYDDAVQQFRDYIHDEPQSPYADDAQFWIGESSLRKGQYSNAIKEFNQVVLRYASGDRSAASLLKLADVFSRIGDQVDARLSLQKLVNRYPGSAEAAEAYRLLQEMGG